MGGDVVAGFKQQAVPFAQQVALVEIEAGSSAKCGAPISSPWWGVGPAVQRTTMLRLLPGP